MSETIGFIGLGLLGLPVAANLLQRGYDLRVYNRTASKAEPLVKQGAHLASTPAEVIIPGGVVVSLVWDDAALESIVGSAGFLERLGQGGVHISMSTVSPECAQTIAARHAAHGSTLIEAPIFGRPEAAVARQLWIPCAGPSAAKERVWPILEAMGSQGTFDMGEQYGAAVTTKLVGNFLIIAASRSIQEALAMVAQNGGDPKAVINMLTSTLLNAPIYKSYGQRIAENPLASAPAGQSQIPLKDVGLFKTQAEKAGTESPIADALLQQLHDQSG